MKVVIIAFLLDKNLPVDEIELNKITDEIIINRQGFLTISNALQRRLQIEQVLQKQ